MITSVDVVNKVAVVELYRASTSGSVHELSWWTTHEDEAIQYGTTVRSRTIEVPIYNIVEGANGITLFMIKINSPYVYGRHGVYILHGIELGLDEIGELVGVDACDVLTVRDVDRYYSVHSCITFCVGSNVINKQLASI